MKLSIVIICWNDRKVITECLSSIVANTHETQFEIIVSDNGSVDGSIEFLRSEFQEVRVIENGRNLGFSGGNNVGIRNCEGEYIIILNPDTIIHDAAFDKWVDYADRHPEAGAFGCRVLNPDGSYQITAYPFPTVWRYWLAALRLQKLGKISSRFDSNVYAGWNGDTERRIDWQSGCCIMFRGDLIKRLGGFDERFFYWFEEVDLCRRVQNEGYRILFTPDVIVTHLGGQSVSRYPLRFDIETLRNRYRYFFKHWGKKGLLRCHRLTRVELVYQQIYLGLKLRLRPADDLRAYLTMRREVLKWNRKINPVRFVENGDEPQVETQGGGLP